MFLIDVLEQLSTDMEKKVFHIHAYLCLCLRECVSLFCRITISNEQVSRLQELCTSFSVVISCSLTSIQLFGHLVMLCHHIPEKRKVSMVSDLVLTPWKVGKRSILLLLNMLEILHIANDGSKYFFMNIFPLFGYVRKVIVLAV